MKSFDEFVNESLIQNIKDPGFNGSDPKSVEIHNRFRIRAIKARILNL